jgi:ABC-type uncharacterized transport system involved in gliding motility auxiliary subunit
MAVADKRRSTLLATLGVLIALVAANTTAWFILRGARIDVTEEKLYTVSPGVNAIAASLPEPVRLEFYWTREQGADLPTVRAYAQRVQEFLEEIAASSGGKLELRVIDPEPFSETEDMARAAGITPRTLDATGRVLMFGLAIRSATDKIESIPFLDPSQEAFLEYEIARRILSVGRDRKSIIAMLSTIPEERAFDPRDPTARPGKSALFSQLDLLYDVRRVDRANPVIPPDASALLVIQPRELGDAALRAIDAWAVEGKPLIVFADPWCEADPEARKLDYGSTGAGTTYDLGPLLAQWGVEIDKQNAVADLGFSTRIMYRTQGGQTMEMSHPAWLSMRKEAFSADDPVTSPISQMNLKGTGAIGTIPGRKTEVSTLISSTKDVQMIQTLKLGFFGEVDRLVRDFKSLGVPVAIGVRIGGEIESAYPATDGTRSKGRANIILIADADMLDDMTWLQIDPQTGEYRTIADNGLFVFNALEQATGDTKLSSLKSRGRYQRPFDRVEQLRKDAESRYLVQEQELQDQIKKSEMRINELQRERGGAGAGVDATGVLVLTPEQTAELSKLETTQIDARRKLREVQRSLRADIEKTGTMLMVLNVVIWPLVVACIATLWISIRYGRQRSAPTISAVK